MKRLRIFHPTDFSPPAAVALHYALDLARRCDAELHVGHVVYGGREYWEADTRSDDENVEIRLRETIVGATSGDPVSDPHEMDVEVHVLRHESAAAGIVHFADVGDMDLVVMGTHGRRGIRRLILGSVAFHVLHGAHTDVLVVPSDFDVPAVGRVLVPVDLHERSEAAVLHGELVADRLGAPLDVLHVLDLPEQSLYRPEQFLAADRGTLREVALDRLGRLIETVDPDAPVALHVEAGVPAHAILHYVMHSDVQLVMMASVGMSPEEHLRMHPLDRDLGDDIRWRVGRVTERVASTSNVPVWVIKRFETQASLSEPQVAARSVAD